MFFKSKPTNLPPAEVLTQQALQALRLTPNDLEMNRQGRLSMTQGQGFEGLVQKGQGMMLIFVPLVLLLSAGVLYFQVASNDATGQALKDTFSENPLILIGGLGGSLLLYILMMAYSYMKARNFTVTDLKVQHVKGKVKITKMQMVGVTWGMMKAAGGQAYSYTIQVGRQTIYAHDPSVEQAFVKDGQYRVYYTKMNRIAYFVSAEAVND